jgi:predicted enzyme related to lactoylglutathione lyase
MPIRYVHTNIVARDWHALASFYIRVLECKPVPPERDLSGPWLDAATGIGGSHAAGLHLRLPGHGPPGPTLEIFSHAQVPGRPTLAPNTPGIVHLAFLVDDVAQTASAVLAAGGSAVGERVTHDVPGVGRLTFQYLRDPEGNMLELQSWQ